MKKGKVPKPNETRPPIDTKGMGFNEVLKRMAQTKPKEVEELEESEKEKKSTSAHEDYPQT